MRLGRNFTRCRAAYAGRMRRWSNWWGCREQASHTRCLRSSAQGTRRIIAACPMGRTKPCGDHCWELSSMRPIADPIPICGQLSTAFRRPAPFLPQCGCHRRFADRCPNDVRGATAFHQLSWRFSEIVIEHDIVWWTNCLIRAVLGHCLWPLPKLAARAG